MGAPNATSGPWRVVPTDSQHQTLISCNEPSGSGKNGGIYVAKAMGPDHVGNAHQMAASGALYDALEAVSGYLPNFPDPDDGPDDIACEIALEWREVHAIRAALALARGESQ